MNYVKVTGALERQASDGMIVAYNRQRRGKNHILFVRLARPGRVQIMIWSTRVARVYEDVTPASFRRLLLVTGALAYAPQTWDACSFYVKPTGQIPVTFLSQWGGLRPSFFLAGRRVQL